MRKSQSGQVSVEILLLSVIFIAAALAVSNSFKRNNTLANLVEGPWSYIDGMSQHGVWAPRNVAKSKDPNKSPRRGSRLEEFSQ